MKLVASSGISQQPRPVRYGFADRWSDRYGGRRLFVRAMLARVQMGLPPWRRLRAIDWRRVENIVFVCKGNICRSAYAAAKAAALGLPSASAGLEAVSGAPANDAARRHAASRMVALNDHRTRRLDELMLNPGTLVVCMEPRQAAEVETMRTGRSFQLTLLGLWSRPLRPLIFDPYGLSDSQWNVCLDIIDNGIERIAAERLRWHDAGSAAM
jgi:protein-tyrosine phosphatase